jgi:hypothetical protein
MTKGAMPDRVDGRPVQCFNSQIKITFQPGKNLRGEAPPATTEGGWRVPGNLFGRWGVIYR